MQIRDSLKVATIIFCFSIILSSMIVACVYFWQDHARSQQIAANLSENLFDMNSTSFFAVPLTQVQSKHLDAYYYEKIFGYLPNLLFIICFFICIASSLLWFILHSFYIRQTVKIISDLSKIQKDEPFYYQNTPIGEALKQLKRVYLNQLSDYKRLGSYLSHDLKNNIAVLKLSLDDKRENLIAIQNLEQLTRSVENILTLTSDSTNEQEEIDIVLLCANICDNYRHSYSQIEFIYSEVEVEIFVRARVLWLKCCISNLVDNAVKYGNDKKITVSVKEEMGGVGILVKDRGIGLSNKEKERIYDYNYRISELQADGYGIGLSVVRYAVTLCQGKISVESVLNKGTTFKIWLPKI